MSATQTLKIGHGNVHNEFDGMQKVLAHKPDSVGFNEAHRQLEHLAGVPGYRLSVPGKTRSSGDVPLLTRNGHRRLGFLQRQVSERVPKADRVAPDRWMNAEFYVHPLATALGAEGFAHFNIHPDAGPKALEGNDPHNAITREYLEALTSAREWMKAARKDNLIPILTGDLQVGEGNTRPWNPRRVIAQPMKLKVAVTHIDWIMYDAKLELDRLDVIQLFDHTGFIATLKAA